MKLRILIFLIVFSAGTNYCRNPENLAGTDLFPAKVIFNAELKLGKDDINQVPVTLPTNALNLAYGAEFFTVGIKPLYNFGEIIILQEKNTQKPSAIAEAGAHDIAAEEIAEGTKQYKQCFYKNIITKEPLLYSECNPLVILVRMLFWQIPDTTGLGDFRVSEACQLKNKADNSINLEATIDAWAALVTYTLSLYKIIALAQARSAKAGKDPSYNPPAVNITPFNKAWGDFRDPLKDNVFLTGIDTITLATLLLDCILWSEKNKIGYDFPIRILMAGVYALTGADQAAIFTFYRKLSDGLSRTKVIPADVMETIIIPANDALPSPFIKNADIDSADAESASAAARSTKNESLIAFHGLNAAVGIFNSIAYSKTIIDGVAFADCFETMIRNIMLALLLQPDQSFNTTITREDISDFLRAYPSMAAQGTGAAHMAWAKLVSKVPGALYSRDGGYELEPSFINMLFMLNYIFDLELEIFSTHHVSIAADQGETNKDLIDTVLPLINKALKEKVKQSHDIPMISIAELYNDVRGDHIECTINAKSFSLAANISIGGHGEISEVTSFEAPKFIDCKPFLFLDRAQHKMPDARAGLCNIVLLQENMSFVQGETFLEALKENTLMMHMLFVFAAQYYAYDQNIFFECMNIFVRNQCCLEAVISVARSGAQSTDLNVVGRSLELLRELIRQDKAFVTAKNVASEYLLNEDPSIKASGIELLKLLIEKDQAFEIAESTASEYLLNEDTNIKSSGITLLKLLIEKNQAFATAESVASERLRSENTSIQDSGLELLELLIEKKQAYDLAAETARRYILSSEYNMWLKGTELFKKLFSQEQAFDIAAEAAQQSLLSDDQVKSSIGSNLLGIIFASNKGLEVARTSMLSTEYKARKKITTLLSNLIHKNQAIEIATQVASLGAESDNPDIRYTALELFYHLVDKNQAFEEAATTACVAVSDDNEQISSYAVSIFSKLFVRNKGFEAAEKAIDILETSNQKSKKRQAADLRTLLSKNRKNS